MAKWNYKGRTYYLDPKDAYDFFVKYENHKITDPEWIEMNKDFLALCEEHYLWTEEGKKEKEYDDYLDNLPWYKGLWAWIAPWLPLAFIFAIINSTNLIEGLIGIVLMFIYVLINLAIGRDIDKRS